MAADYSGEALIPSIQKHFFPGAAILELGMGPGKDMQLLQKSFKVTGSDESQIFLDLYKEKHPNADVLRVNAVDIKLNTCFDGIYSNKVLHHLKKTDLQSSFRSQNEHLNPGGKVFHTFWLGDSEEYFDDLRFVYYTPDSIKALYTPFFEHVETEIYSEMEKNDSFFLVLQKKSYP